MCFIIVSEPQTNHRIPSRPFAVDKCTCVLQLNQMSSPIFHKGESFLDPKCSAYCTRKRHSAQRQLTLSVAGPQGLHEACMEPRARTRVAAAHRSLISSV